jgi:hypothetical protein
VVLKSVSGVPDDTALERILREVEALLMKKPHSSWTPTGVAE